MAGSVADGVADVVLRWFQASAVCQKKHPPTEWTVIAGIVVHSTAGEEPPAAGAESAFRVLACATGTKCLGRRDLDTRGLVVNDCHAEILARRALLRFLYTEALVWTAAREKGDELPSTSLFERHPTTHRLVLKPQHTLHLYISEAPCGDAAIYQLREDIIDELVKQRVERNADTAERRSATEAAAAIGAVAKDTHERSAFRLTGAKAKRKHSDETTTSSSTNENAQRPPEKRFDQMVGIARVKSGRSDLPPDKQTLSMSCSDKLAKWNAVGIQGTLLLQWYEPLFLRSIVVSCDDTCVSTAAQYEALERAICCRFKESSWLQQRSEDKESALLPTCALHIIAREFPCKKPPTAAPDSARKVPSSLALNWSTHMAHWHSTIASETLYDTSHHFAAADTQHEVRLATLLKKFFQTQDVEVLMGATGLKQGAKRLSKMTDIETQRVASRVAKWTFFLAFRHIVAMESALDDADAGVSRTFSLSYAAAKDAIPIAASSSTPTQNKSTSSKAIDCIRERRQGFLTAIKGWVGVPHTYKQFSI